MRRVSGFILIILTQWQHVGVTIHWFCIFVPLPLCVKFFMPLGLQIFLVRKPSVTTEISCLKLLLWGCRTFSLPSLSLFRVLFACKFLLIKHNRKNFIIVLSDLISTSVTSTVSLSTVDQI